jgi:hypothetical protein
MSISPGFQKLLFTAVGASLVLIRVESAAQAASFTNPANGHTYTLTSLASWTDAQAQAVSLGGNLVTINDATEQSWLLNTFGSTNLFWIGFTDRNTEGVFEWISGETSLYTNWSVGEPNDLFGEDYAVMNQGRNGAWNDQYNSGFGGPHAGIVEIPATAVPTPALLPGLIGLGVGAARRRRLKRSIGAIAM